MAHDERAISDLLEAFTRALYMKEPQALSHHLPTMRLLLTSHLRSSMVQTFMISIVSEPSKRTIVIDENVAYA